MPMQRVPSAHAISRREFHALLRAWLRDTTDTAIGPPDVPGWTRWVHVWASPTLFALLAETPRAATESYLRLVDRHGDDLSWAVVEVEDGGTAVAFGPDGERVPGFSLIARAAK
jgi:hypothetical protein